MKNNFDNPIPILFRLKITAPKYINVAFAQLNDIDKYEHYFFWYHIFLGIFMVFLGIFLSFLVVDYQNEPAKYFIILSLVIFGILSYIFAKKGFTIKNDVRSKSKEQVILLHNFYDQNESKQTKVINKNHILKSIDDKIERQTLIFKSLKTLQYKIFFDKPIIEFETFRFRLIKLSPHINCEEIISLLDELKIIKIKFDSLNNKIVEFNSYIILINANLPTIEGTLSTTP